MNLPRHHVVSCDVHDDDSTVLNIRFHGRWVHAEVNPSDLQNESLREEYLSLVASHRLGENDEDAHSDIGNESGQTTDSGYVTDNDGTKTKKGNGQESAKQADGKSLQDWLLSALDTVLAEIPSTQESKEKQNLHEWYNARVHCYAIKAEGGKARHLSVIPRDDLDGEAYAKTQLTPHIDLPKYIRTQKAVPWYSPTDLTVEDEADDIHLSIHPTLVSIAADKVPKFIQELSDCSTLPQTCSNNKTSSGVKRKNVSECSGQHERFTCFLKLAQPHDPKSVKHEIKTLQRLEKLDLYSKGLRAPHLAGLVSTSETYTSSQDAPPKQLLGFLSTLVPQPTTPLTHFMDTSVSESQREDYAAQAQAMVDVLHEHDMVWGDAKADNFLVDCDGMLWMIDFGGSFTPGWIDEELADTVDGDNAGTEKIVNGLRQPNQCVESGTGTGESSGHGNKDATEEGSEREAPSKGDMIAKKGRKNDGMVKRKQEPRSITGDETSASASKKRKTEHSP